MLCLSVFISPFYLSSTILIHTSSRVLPLSSISGNFGELQLCFSTLWPFEDEDCALGKPAHDLPSPTSSSNKEAAADPIHSG